MFSRWIPLSLCLVVLLIISGSQIALAAPIGIYDVQASWSNDQYIQVTWHCTLCDSYVLERRNVDAGGDYVYIAFVEEVTSYVDYEVANDTRYQYRVIFKSYTGLSNIVNLSVPNAPSNLIATWSNYQVNLTWVDNSSFEQGFKIYRSGYVKGGSWSSWSQVATVAANTTAWTDTNPPYDRAKYKVNAYNSSVNSAYSNEAMPITVPYAPSNFQATPETGKVTLTWTDNSDFESKFWLYCTRSNGTNCFSWPHINVNANSTSYTNYYSCQVGDTYALEAHYYDPNSPGRVSDQVTVQVATCP